MGKSEDMYCRPASQCIAVSECVGEMSLLLMSSVKGEAVWRNATAESGNDLFKEVHCNANHEDNKADCGFMCRRYCVEELDLRWMRESRRPVS